MLLPGDEVADEPTVRAGDSHFCAKASLLAPLWSLALSRQRLRVMLSELGRGVNGLTCEPAKEGTHLPGMEMRSWLQRVRLSAVALCALKFLIWGGAFCY